MESLDLGQKSLIHAVGKMSTGQSTSYVNLFDDVDIRAQVPNVTFDSLRGNPTGVNDNIDVICK